MSAVRMVAYGVLELKHKKLPAPPWVGNRSLEEVARDQIDDLERDTLRKLVNDELRRYGLLLTRMVVPKGQGWRTKMNAHILYGQVRPGGWLQREILHEGEFKDCCIKAAELLDKLDASQVPDTAAGPDQR